MTIEQGRIVATSAKREGMANVVKPTPFCPLIASVVPPISYITPSGFFPQPAEYEGQVRVVENSSNGEYSMYVVVKIGGGLEWKQVKKTSGALDPRTGRPYDANAVFYNPLAN